jgi:hypothetical protein
LLESQAALHSCLLPAADPARAKLPDNKQILKRMFFGISPICETSPINAELSSQESAF